MAEDFLGEGLTVGDEVVFTRLHYRELSRGKIIKVMPKTLLIIPDGWRNPVKQFHKQVVKINKGR